VLGRDDEVQEAEDDEGRERENGYFGEGAKGFSDEPRRCRSPRVGPGGGGQGVGAGPGRTR